MLDPSDASQKTRNVRNPSGANAPAVEVGGVLVSTGLLTSGWAARHEEVGQETGREIGSDIVWHGRDGCLHCGLCQCFFCPNALEGDFPFPRWP
jgi:hypothetical protein